MVRGKWACHKLECLSEFLHCYSESWPDSVLIVPFTGPETNLCRDCSLTLPGIEQRAAGATFSRYVFVVRNTTQSRDLAERLRGTPAQERGTIVVGSLISSHKVRELLDCVPRSASSLALIDAHGYRRIRWSLLKALASHGEDWQGRKMGLLVVLPLEMGLMHNLTRPECEASINHFFGNRYWQRIREGLLSGSISPDEASQALVELYRKGLKRIGYRYIQLHQARCFDAKFSYHIIYASDTPRPTLQIDHIWDKPRYLPCELFYRQKTS